MDIFDVLTMIGGLCLFLFGMNVMGESLERAAGNSLRTLLGKLTGSRIAGFLTGLAVTAVIQSSSATTVMVVGFVNSGLLTLSQAIGVIMGANVGTTVTAWILSLGGISGESLFMQLLKPSSFTPVLALIGIIYYMFIKDSKKKDIGMILLGFAVLMFGMDTMSGAVKGLRDEPWFTNLFLLFKNPILGVIAGAALTGIIQSSSASVGILQALSATGAISFGASIPIIMGQNIGTTVTALLSSVGTNKNARRAAVVHMMFNVIGTLIGLAIFMLVDAIFSPAILNQPTDYLGISICHTAFNILCTSVLLPSGALLEKIACKIVPDAKVVEEMAELDERLLATPSIALERCREVAGKLAAASAQTLREGVGTLTGYTPEQGEKVQELENLTDHYEGILGDYLVKLSALRSSEADSNEVTILLKAINDFERIADHGQNLMEAGQEMYEKKLEFSKAAREELAVLTTAVDEVIDLAFGAFLHRDLDAAYRVEPLEEVIDSLKEQMRTRHILRMQQGMCSIEAGFVWSDLLTSLERVSDHCSNIAGAVIDLISQDRANFEALRSAKIDYSHFGELFTEYTDKYSLS
ncbi:MAG: Na/Pi cotransporter family protein [Oscillospiraceae bacterium]|nr:Na/Pi cotransporter family protein [Oscillospiraceae bacterium]